MQTDSTKKKKVLIVEDEVPMAKAMKLKLEHSVPGGMEVKLAFDGDEALRLVSEEKFDVLILDLVIPQKDGFTVLQELKKREDKVPVVVMTNLSQEADIKRAKNLGVLDYLVKSETSLSEFVNKIKKILGL